MQKKVNTVSHLGFNILLMGTISSEATDTAMRTICLMLSLTSLISHKLMVKQRTNHEFKASDI